MSMNATETLRFLVAQCDEKQPCASAESLLRPVQARRGISPSFCHDYGTFRMAFAFSPLRMNGIMLHELYSTSRKLISSHNVSR